MIAQFFSALADNALLIAAIALLAELHAAAWTTPVLKLGFNGAYVALAVIAGAVADAWPKGQVMLAANLIKIAGCLLLLTPVHPLLGYAVVGIGAALLSPAKFGILSELMPAQRLVHANGWMEGSTVIAIILGTVLGGLLVSPHALAQISGDAAAWAIQADSPARRAVLLIGVLYGISVLLCLRIPLTRAADARPGTRAAQSLVLRFFAQCRCLWRDPQGRLSLSVTTLFWGAGATLQFIVLKWAGSALGMPLGKAAILQATVALGVVLGAAGAGRWVPLQRSFRVLPTGIVLGLTVLLLIVVRHVWVAVPLLFVVGALGGFFLIPMNAVLQARGQSMMSAGQSIAVQNFSENVAILAMLGLYALLVRIDVAMNIVILLFGVMLSGIMLLLSFGQRRHTRAA